MKLVLMNTILVLTLPALAQITGPSGYLWSQEIVRLIKTHDLTSIDELVPLLPSPIKEKALFAYSGNALLPSSESHPRPVLFEPESGFTLTYKAHSTMSGDDALEAMEWDAHEGRIRFLAINFPLENPQEVAWSEPAKCAQCHGAKLPKPIWGEYPDWPGFFGSHDDKLSSFEREIKEKMIIGHWTNPRLRPLLNRFDSYPDAPYIEPGTVNSRRSSWAHMRPNENFGEIASRMAAQQISHFLQPLSATEKAGLAYQLAGCNGYGGKVDLQKYGLSPEDFDLGVTAEQNSTRDFWTSYFDGSALMRELVAARLAEQILPPHRLARITFKKSGIYPPEHPGNQLANPIIQTIDSWGSWIPSPFDDQSRFEQERIRGVWPRALQRRFQRACSTLKTLL